MTIQLMSGGRSRWPATGDGINSTNFIVNMATKFSWVNKFWSQIWHIFYFKCQKYVQNGNKIGIQNGYTFCTYKIAQFCTYFWFLMSKICTKWLQNGYTKWVYKMGIQNCTILYIFLILSFKNMYKIDTKWVYKMGIQNGYTELHHFAHILGTWKAFCTHFVYIAMQFCTYKIA